MFENTASPEGVVNLAERLRSEAGADPRCQVEDYGNDGYFVVRRRHPDGAGWYEMFRVLDVPGRPIAVRERRGATITVPEAWRRFEDSLSDESTGSGHPSSPSG